MTFREFLKMSEQGTPTSVTGLNAAGRAGQGFGPESGIMSTPSPNSQIGDQNAIKGPKSIPASAFNTSSKFKTLVPRPFGGLNAGGVQPNPNPAASPVSPRGFQSSQPLRPQQSQGQTIKVPKPSASGL